MYLCLAIKCSVMLTTNDDITNIPRLSKSFGKVNVKGIDRQTVKNVQMRFCGKSIKLTHLALKTDSVELFTRDT